MPVNALPHSDAPNGGDDADLKPVLNGRKVVVMALNFGPYHVARMAALAKALDAFGASLVGIELAGTEGKYPWRVARHDHGFEWRTLAENSRVEDVQTRAQRRLIRRALNEITPAVVLIPGWDQAFQRSALHWCRKNDAVSVVCSDSARQTREDANGPIPRKWYIEVVKKAFVRRFDAGVAAGKVAREYLIDLGLRPERVFLKYDVVDNGFFARTADETQVQADYRREHYRLPARFFFFPSRLLPKKNHSAFLDAYAEYALRCANPWKLIILGSGPSEAQVDAKIASLGLPGIERRPFAQIEDVARYYALASALVIPSTTETWGLVINEAAAAGLPVLASNRCPATEHLVIPGANGWTFDPFDVHDMTEVLLRMTGLTDGQRRQMGEAGRRIMADWDVKDFATEVLRAIASVRLPRHGR